MDRMPPPWLVPCLVPVALTAEEEEEEEEWLVFFFFFFFFFGGGFSVLADFSATLRFTHTGATLSLSILPPFLEFRLQVLLSSHSI